MQTGLAGVRRAKQGDLRRPFGADRVDRTAAARALLRPSEILGELLNSTLDIRLKMFGTFVLGYRPQHLLQTSEAFLLIPRFAEHFLGFLIVWAQIGGHCILLPRLCITHTVATCPRGPTRVSKVQPVLTVS